MASRLFRYNLDSVKEVAFSVKTGYNSLTVGKDAFKSLRTNGLRAPLQLNTLGASAGKSFISNSLSNQELKKAEDVMRLNWTVDNITSLHSSTPMAQLSGYKSNVSTAAFQLSELNTRNQRFLPTRNLHNLLQVANGNEDWTTRLSALNDAQRDFLKAIRKADIERGTYEVSETQDLIEPRLARFYGQAALDPHGEKGKIVLPLRNAWRLNAFLPSKSTRQFFGNISSAALSHQQAEVYPKSRYIIESRAQVARWTGFAGWNEMKAACALRPRAPPKIKRAVPIDVTTSMSDRVHVLHEVHDQISALLDKETKAIVAAAQKTAGSDADGLRLSMDDFTAVATHAQGVLEVPRRVLPAFEKDALQGPELLEKTLNLFGKIHGLDVSFVQRAAELPLGEMPVNSLVAKMRLRTAVDQPETALNTVYIYVLPSAESREAPLPLSASARLLMPGHVAISTSLITPSASRAAPREVFYQDVLAAFRSLGAARVMMFPSGPAVELDETGKEVATFKADLIAEDCIAAAAAAHEMVAHSPEFWKLLVPSAAEALTELQGKQVPLLPILTLVEAAIVSSADLAVHDGHAFRADRARDQDMQRFLLSELQLRAPFTLPPTFDPVTLLRTSFTPSRASAPQQQRVLGYVDGAWWALQTVQVMRDRKRLALSPYGSQQWISLLNDQLDASDSHISLEEKLGALRTVLKGDYEANLKTSELFKKPTAAPVSEEDVMSAVPHQRGSEAPRITSYKPKKTASSLGK